MVSACGHHANTVQLFQLLMSMGSNVNKRQIWERVHSAPYSVFIFATILNFEIIFKLQKTKTKKAVFLALVWHWICCQMLLPPTPTSSTSQNDQGLQQVLTGGTLTFTIT